MTKLKICSLILFPLFFVAGWISAEAQSQAGTSTQPPTEALVTLNITVIDSSGHSVTDLRKEDFELFDEGNPETISYFSKETPPVIYGLLIDNSGSLKNHLRTIVHAAQQIVAANLDNDETFIVRFISSDKIETLQAITSDKAALTRALNGLKTEMGQTAVVDALYISAQYAIKHQATRRAALILVSDGEDRASYYREEQLFELLRKSNLQVFALGFVGELDDRSNVVRKSPRQKATEFITKLARETDGHAFILKSPNEISDAIVQLTQRLHSQYVVRYTPTRNVDKLKRKVQVKLTKSPEHEKWRVIVGKAELRTSTKQ